jgi:secondary thiamine-phosphate synthase enzyme
MVLTPLPLSPAREAVYACWSESVDLHTAAAPEFVDLTEQVEGVVARSGVTDGAALIFSRHTTAAIVINEFEPLLLEDMVSFLERIAPRAASYRHNDFSVRTVNMTADESPNGHAHCLQLLLGASQTVPIAGGRLALGQWQRIFLVELDHARPRQVVVQASGITGVETSRPSFGLPQRNGARH